MAQKLDLKIRGLYTNPNAFSEVPEGALLVADNVVIEKESIVESRRGQATYGTELTPSPGGTLNKLFNYRNRLLLNYGNKLAYDSDNAGTWVDYSGTYEAPDTGYKIRSIEANRNFYFTTSTGIKKLDSPTGTVTIAGAYKGLDGVGSTTGSSGFMTTATNVAYRIVWGYVDANNNLILGAPSQRVIVSNTSGGFRDVSLTFTIPSGVTTSWFYQIYRSGESASVADQPNDELQLVIENNPTAAEITALSFTTTDQTPNDLRGVTLYTSPSQQGIANANETPPYAKDMAVFKGHVFYANVKSKQRLYLTLVAVGGNSFTYLVDGTVDTVDTTPTLTNISSTTTLKVGMRVVGTGIPSNARILSIDSATQVTMNVDATATATVSVEFQDRVTINNVAYYGGSANDVATNTFQVETGGTPAENIDVTAQNLVQIVNVSASNTELYAYYVSGFDELPGRILFEERVVGGEDFYATSTYGDSFNPVLPMETYITSISMANPTTITATAHGLSDLNSITIYDSNSTPTVDGERIVDVQTANTFTVPVNVTVAGTEGYFILTDRIVSSDNEEKQNRVFFSKNGQPEAVPLYTYVDAGSADAPIYRIIALRDSIFLFKADGIYRITGEDLQSFRVSLFDNTATLKAPESAVAFNNQVFAMSDQGVMSVSDNGVSVVSRPIEDTLLQISSEQYTFFNDATFAVGYESSRLYMLFTVTEKEDEYATQAFVYNSFTNSWTRWVMNRTAGIVNTRDNKLYMTNPVNDFVYKERKNFDLTDFADEQYPVTIVSSSLFVVTLADATAAVAGLSLKQSGREALILSVDQNTEEVTLDKVLAWQPGDAAVYEPIPNEIQWVPTDIENPGILKQYREITLLFRDAAFREYDVSFYTNFSTNPVTVPIFAISIGPWGTFPWGTIKWGGGVGGQQPIRTYVPLEKQRANWLNISVSGSQAFTSFSLAGVSVVFTPMSERFR
jgi:hypothetical protein